MAAEEKETWYSTRRQVEMDNADRVRYFDKFIDLVLAGELDFDTAIESYKETLEYQGIPISPESGSKTI